MKRIPFVVKMILLTNAVVLSILLIVHTLSASESKETCKLVHIIFRHGDRTPTETYHNDPYKNYNWPDGWGALTKNVQSFILNLFIKHTIKVIKNGIEVNAVLNSILLDSVGQMMYTSSKITEEIFDAVFKDCGSSLKGKSQCYELGVTLHERYKYFFPKNVSTNSIRVMSSDADRCHMSAATFLVGFFPPTDGQIWNPNFNWHPIPIHSLPRNLDNLVAMKKKCSTYDRALQESYRSKELQKLNKDNKELYDFLAKETGEDMSNITAVEFLYNTLEIEDDNGLKLPEWTKDIYPKKLKQIATRSLEIFTETNFMKRMKGGVLLKEMIKNIKLKQEKQLKIDKNVYIYSAHDISLINFMRVLDLAHDLKPEYGAAFVLETHETSNEDFEIKFLYYNSYSSKEPQELNFDKCGTPCFFKKFIEVTRDMVPENWEKECENLS